MYKIFVFATILITFFALLGFAEEGAYAPGELLIQLQPQRGSDEQNIQSLTKSFEHAQLAPKKQISRRMNIWHFQFNSNRINDQVLLNSIKKHPAVQRVQFNHRVELRSTYPDDPNFGQQWNMENTGQTGGYIDADIDAPEAWDFSTDGLTATGDTVVVAIIDDGFSINHEDLYLWKNYGEIPDNDIDDDGNGYVDDYHGWNAYSSNGTLPIATHGTHVTGIAAAKGNNGIGVTGVNWNTQIMPVAGSSSYESTVVEAYTYVLDMRALYNETGGQQGAFVVSTNASFGVNYGDPENFPLWSAIYDSLGVQGILSAAATMNNNSNVDVVGDMPTSCDSDYLITVTNTTQYDTKNGGAAYGLTTIDLGAPGTSVYSTKPNNTYGNMTGTSMASPHVAGAVGLLFAAASLDFMDIYWDDLSTGALMVKDYILAGTDPLPSLEGITVTGGRLNVYNSIQMISQPNPGISGHITQDTTWAGSAIRVVGEVTVDDGVTLTIDPGTTVEFEGHYKLNIQGRLLAIGTENNPITFTVDDTTGFSNFDSTAGAWHGIRFDNTPATNDTSQIQYCIIEYGKAIGDSGDQYGGGIYINDFDKVMISHSIIRNNYSQDFGGGIHINQSNINLNYNEILYNTTKTDTTGYGGGLYSAYSQPIITHNLISQNYCEYLGGGATFYFSDPIFNHNTISWNYCNYIGGGISFLDSTDVEDSPALTHNVVEYNSTLYFGGAISCNRARPVLHNWTVANNSAGQSGGGLFCNEGYPIINSSIFYFNTAMLGNEMYLWDSNSAPEITYCDIQEGLEGIHGSGEPAIYEDCISEDPLFVNNQWDYHLQYGSPCINTGDPNLPLDPDDTITEMGAFHFDNLELYGNLEGVVMNIQTEEAIEGAIITADEYTAVTDSQGYYFINGLLVGQYDVNCSASNYFDDSAEDVLIQQDQTTQLDFDLQMIDHGNLHGYVTDDETDEPIQGATVSIGEFSATTDAEGYYLIEDILIGIYDVTCSANNYIEQTVSDVVIQGGETTQWGFGLLPMEVGTILLVDDDGSSWYPGDFSNVVSYYTDALDLVGADYELVEVYSPNENGPDYETLSQYDIVIWFTGECYASSGVGVFTTLTDTDETNLGQYLDNGGRLFLSAQDYLWDRYQNAGNFYAGQFPYDYLHLNSVSQDAWYVDASEPGTASGGDGSVADGMVFDLFDPFTASRNGLYIDLLNHNGTDVFLLSSPTGAGAMQYDSGIYKVVFSTISFAGLMDGDTGNKADFMGNILSYFGVITQNDVEVTMIDSVSNGAESVSLPIIVSDLTGKNIVSYSFTLAYDENVLEATEISVVNSLSDGMGHMADITNGEISVGAWSDDPLTGEGDLIYVTFNVVGALEDSTFLSFNDFAFNEGNPEALYENPLAMFKITDDVGIMDNNIAIPNTFTLGNNYPNPFNPSTTIAFTIPYSEGNTREVKLNIYDLSGKLIKTLVDSPMGPGYHSVVWNGKDDAEQDVASGVYFYRLETDDFTETKKCLLIK